MEQRKKAGRPKLGHPKAIKVTVRLTERAVDVLYRMHGDCSLSEAIRRCIFAEAATRGGCARIPDTDTAKLKRAQRHGSQPEQSAGERLIVLCRPLGELAREGGKDIFQGL